MGGNRIADPRDERIERGSAACTSDGLFDRTTALVTENHDHLRLDVFVDDAVLDAGHGERIGDVAGCPEHEDLTDGLAENQLRRQAAVRAGEDRDGRVLRHRQILPKETQTAEGNASVNVTLI